MANYKIKYDRNACIGAGTCVEACPENYSLDSEGKAVVKKKDINDKELKKNIEAAKSCPVQAIKIYDEKGKEMV